MPRILVPIVGLVGLTAIGAGTPSFVLQNTPVTTPRKAEAKDGTSALSAACPPDTLPDGDACVHWSNEGDEAPESQAAQGAHSDGLGHWVIYDQIPLRSDRSPDYATYRYPIPCRTGCVVSGYDLDQSDALQRRTHRRVGHGAVDLAAPRGTPVELVALAHQEGDAEIMYAGPLFGTTIVTRHKLREGNSLRDYLVFYGHLDSVAPGLAAHLGSVVREGDTLGFVGDSGSPGLIHLHFETRRVRDGVTLLQLPPSAWVDNSASIVCDPRNVLRTK